MMPLRVAAASACYYADMPLTLFSRCYALMLLLRADMLLMKRWCHDWCRVYYAPPLMPFLIDWCRWFSLFRCFDYFFAISHYCFRCHFHADAAARYFRFISPLALLISLTLRHAADYAAYAAAALLMRLISSRCANIFFFQRHIMMMPLMLMRAMPPADILFDYCWCFADIISIVFISSLPSIFAAFLLMLMMPYYFAFISLFFFIFLFFFAFALFWLLFSLLLCCRFSADAFTIIIIFRQRWYFLHFLYSLFLSRHFAYALCLMLMSLRFYVSSPVDFHFHFDASSIFRRLPASMPLIIFFASPGAIIFAFIFSLCCCCLPPLRWCFLIISSLYHFLRHDADITIAAADYLPDYFRFSPFSSSSTLMPRYYHLISSMIKITFSISRCHYAYFAALFFFRHVHYFHFSILRFLSICCALSLFRRHALPMPHFLLMPPFSLRWYAIDYFAISFIADYAIFADAFIFFDWCWCHFRRWCHFRWLLFSLSLLISPSFSLSITLLIIDADAIICLPLFSLLLRLFSLLFWCFLSIIFADAAAFLRQAYFRLSSPLLIIYALSARHYFLRRHDAAFRCFIFRHYFADFFRYDAYAARRFRHCWHCWWFSPLMLMSFSPLCHAIFFAWWCYFLRCFRWYVFASLIHFHYFSFSDMSFADDYFAFSFFLFADYFLRHYFFFFAIFAISDCCCCWCCCHYFADVYWCFRCPLPLSIFAAEAVIFAVAALFRCQLSPLFRWWLFLLLLAIFWCRRCLCRFFAFLLRRLSFCRCLPRRFLFISSPLIFCHLFIDDAVSRGGVDFHALSLITDAPDFHFAYFHFRFSRRWYYSFDADAAISMLIDALLRAIDYYFCHYAIFWYYYAYAILLFAAAFFLLLRADFAMPCCCRFLSDYALLLHIDADDATLITRLLPFSLPMPFRYVISFSLPFSCHAMLPPLRCHISTLRLHFLFRCFFFFWCRQRWYFRRRFFDVVATLMMLAPRYADAEPRFAAWLCCCCCRCRCRYAAAAAMPCACCYDADTPFSSIAPDFSMLILRCCW